MTKAGLTVRAVENACNLLQWNQPRCVIVLQSKPTLTKAGLAVGVIGAAGVLLFNEVEVVLELLGVAAVGNFLAKRVLFAKDREQTVEEFK